MRELVARWESKSGKYFVTLFQMTEVELNGDIGFAYEGNGIAGQFNVGSLETAILYIEQHKAIAGIAMPDDAKTPMIRVK